MNKKIIVFSFDDGTIYDFKLLDLFNKYKLKATFNLNSSLKDYVWFNQGLAIKRFDLEKNKEIYKGHEVASHTKRHMYLSSLDENTLIDEVEGDRKKLSDIFKREVTSFAVPFDQISEEIINLIKLKTKIEAIRIPKYQESFSLPNDAYHIGANLITSEPLSLKTIFDRFEDFLRDEEPISLFLVAGHSYDFEVFKKWDFFELFLKKVSETNGVDVLTMRELARTYLKKRD